MVGRVLLRLGRRQRRIPHRQRDLPDGTRALAIAAFYAVGTGIGGIIGPQLFGRLIPTGKTSDVFFALALGAILMIGGGLVEIIYGIKAERKGLEGIATPLTAVQSDAGTATA